MLFKLKLENGVYCIMKGFACSAQKRLCRFGRHLVSRANTITEFRVRFEPTMFHRLARRRHTGQPQTNSSVHWHKAALLRGVQQRTPDSQGT